MTLAASPSIAPRKEKSKKEQRTDTPELLDLRPQEAALDQTSIDHCAGEFQPSSFTCQSSQLANLIVESKLLDPVSYNGGQPPATKGVFRKKRTPANNQRSMKVKENDFEIPSFPVHVVARDETDGISDLFSISTKRDRDCVPAFSSKDRAEKFLQIAIESPTALRFVELDQREFLGLIKTLKPQTQIVFDPSAERGARITPITVESLIRRLKSRG